MSSLSFPASRPSFILGYCIGEWQNITTPALVSVPSEASMPRRLSTPAASAGPSPMRPAALPISTNSRTAASSTSSMGLPDGSESQGLRARSRSMIIVVSSDAAICLFDVPTRVKYRPSAEYGASMPENATRMYALASSSVRRSIVGEMDGSTLSEIQPAIWRIVASVASCPMTSPLSLTPK